MTIKTIDTKIVSRYLSKGICSGEFNIIRSDVFEKLLDRAPTVDPVEYGVIEWPKDETKTFEVTIEVSDQENISAETRDMVLRLIQLTETRHNLTIPQMRSRAEIVRRLREKLEATPVFQRWQPIATVPLGETVLLCKWLAEEKTMMWIASGRFNGCEDGWFCEVSDRSLRPTPSAGFFRPTHWMKLPEPPE